METKTDPTTATGNKKVITNTNDGIKIIKTIFDWEARWLLHWDENKRHSHSHCLLRIYLDESVGRVAVIASELYSNNANISVGLDFEGLAQAVVNRFSSEINTPLPQAIWIEHYGRFSTARSYENLDIGDSFSRIDLHWNNLQVLGEGEETVLDRELSELLDWINVEPVEKVLLELDAVSASDWITVYLEENRVA